MIYSPWKKLAHSSLHIIPIELSGRGGRMGQPLYSSITGDGLDDLFRSMEKHLDGSPFAIFGHSMGTLFTYELSRRMHQKTGQRPVHIFLSGRSAPHKVNRDKFIYNLPDSEFQNEILELGGTPKQLFEEKELSDIYMPILRSDYRLVETYEVENREHKIDCDITALWGNKDRHSRTDTEAWQEYTNGSFRLIEFDGGHFFLHEYPEQIVDVIYQTLSSKLEIIGGISNVKEITSVN
jgi:medium-chain acyl-[acyl-carrier-protein] hydrolase